jgi:hypothetical protein
VRERLDAVREELGRVWVDGRELPPPEGGMGVESLSSEAEEEAMGVDRSEMAESYAEVAAAELGEAADETVREVDGPATEITQDEGHAVRSEAEEAVVKEGESYADAVKQPMVEEETTPESMATAPSEMGGSYDDVAASTVGGSYDDVTAEGAAEKEVQETAERGVEANLEAAQGETAEE